MRRLRRVEPWRGKAERTEQGAAKLTQYETLTLLTFVNSRLTDSMFFKVILIFTLNSDHNVHYG